MSALLLTALFTDLIAFINPAKDYFLGNCRGVGEEAFEVNWLLRDTTGAMSTAQGGENTLLEHLSARLNPNITVHSCKRITYHFQLILIPQKLGD